MPKKTTPVVQQINFTRSAFCKLHIKTSCDNSMIFTFIRSSKRGQLILQVPRQSACGGRLLLPLLDAIQERASGEEVEIRETLEQCLAVDIFCMCGCYNLRLPGFLISLVMSTRSSELSSWLSWFLIFFSWQGDG